MTLTPWTEPCATFLALQRTADIEALAAHLQSCPECQHLDDDCALLLEGYRANAAPLSAALEERLLGCMCGKSALDQLLSADRGDA